VQRLSFDEFHDDERQAIVISDVMYSYDVGMIQFSDELGFMQKTRSAMRIQGTVRDDFDGYISLEQGISGAVNFPHAALSKNVINPVAFA
jgi:hypothetical protein